jgi:hypothetical protein
MPGIVETLETIGDLKNLSVDGIALVKSALRGPLGIGGIFTGVLKVVADVKELADAPLALPELKDLDATEAGQIGAASYVCVKAIIAALVA